jgi:hypothetical protein
MTQFVLTGFTPDTGFRVFAFDGIAADRSHTPFTVRADLGLIRLYGILVQELPLLCREFLERREEGALERAVTFSEAEMQLVAGARTLEREAAARKKSLRRIPPRRAPTDHAAVMSQGA